MHENNCFLTLTYDDKHVPWDGSLNKQHFQKFMKRLRFHYRDRKIRYFHCGEYGKELHRPHYHALLFGLDFDDKILWSQRDGIPTYVSETLAKLWPFGFSTVGRLTWETAAYCARYTTKKKTGKAAQEHYWRPVSTDLEVLLEPEYATMSLKPAIGRTWFDTYKTDCYPSDYVTSKGKKFRVPKYYDTLLKQEDPEQLAKLKRERILNARKRHAENTPQRLRDREMVAQAKLSTLNRPLEGT